MAQEESVLGHTVSSNCLEVGRRKIKVIVSSNCLEVGRGKIKVIEKLPPLPLSKESQVS